jgi:hypothetical protein
MLLLQAHAHTHITITWNEDERMIPKLNKEVHKNSTATHIVRNRSEAAKPLDFD